MRTFHVTIGPVQSFVSQARRTRDLWAGSFLLSWLSGHAMKSVLDQGGTIIFPKVTNDNGVPTDPLLIAIFDNSKSGENPHIGSLPNRFKADIPDDSRFNPEEVTKAINRAWGRLADTVYTRFVASVANQGKGVNEIWNRQTKNFWEINWVLGKKPVAAGTDDLWLDTRKHWRNHWPLAEHGDHCTVMGDYQELSGYIRARERATQNAFWQAIRKNAPDDYLDIRENERLCAIALIKRLFPRLRKMELITTIGWVPGGDHKAIGNWPSTTYLAVAPWLSVIDGDANKIRFLDNYSGQIHQQVKGDNFFCKLASERATHLARLPLLNTTSMSCGKWRLSDIDGDLLHIHALRNYRTTYLSDKPLTNQGKDANSTERGVLESALGQLYTDVGTKPRSYYAVLLMDGDRLGEMLRGHPQDKVSQALLDFTQQVPNIVDKEKRHSGVTIYAGGDDVLALLPLDTAIACAQALRKSFAESFRNADIEKATASCAIILAHHQLPLRNVLNEAHHQLECIAKDGNGRDSLAIALYKPGGVVAQWVSVWEDSNKNLFPVSNLQALIATMLSSNEEYPRGFFHKLRDRYGLFTQSSSASQIDLKKLLVSEYLQSRDRNSSPQQAETAITRLLAACQPLYKNENGNPETTGQLQLDGGFIARFLSQEED